MFFQGPFDAGCHQVAHRASRANPRIVYIDEDWCPRQSLLRQFTYVISAFSASDACWSQYGLFVADRCTATIREHPAGVKDRYLWGVYVKEHDGSRTCGMRPAEPHTLDDTDC